MKIFLLHGDDEVKSYERLQKFIETAKSRSWEVVYIDDSPFSFQETLSGAPLFPGERFFILRDIKKLGKKETDWLKKKSEYLQGNLVIYHLGTVNITLIKTLPESLKIEEFKLPKIVFQFLESLMPKNAKRSIELLHELLKKDPPESLFFFLSRHVRDLYWAKTDEKSLPYPSWRIDKLRGQTGKFSVNQLSELIDKLCRVDVEVKTSDAEIIPSLDLLIATKLE